MYASAVNTAPLLLLGLLASSQALDNGLAMTPPMGWNSWNKFHCDVNQDLIVETAEQITALGLDKLGYTYVNIDDCWMATDRTDEENALVGDGDRFPDGMKWMGDYLHMNNLYFGIYSSAGTKTCAKYPASLGYEQIDAQTFANWGVDYLKYDNCFHENIPSIDRYSVMRDALNATGRPILYSVCQWGTENSWQWAASVGNIWRSTRDIQPEWQYIRYNFWKSQKHFEQSQNGAWLDPDMLEVGNGDLTYEENKSHFSLWAFVKAPLLLGNDLSKITPEILGIVSNTEIIGVNQDPNAPHAVCYRGCHSSSNIKPPPHVEYDSPLKDGEKATTQAPAVNGEEGDEYDDSCPESTTLVKGQDDYSVFATTLGDGAVAALVMNWEDEKTIDNLTLNVVQILGIVPSPTQRVYIRDLWTHQPVVNSNTGVASFGYEDLKNVPVPTLKPHDCAVYTFTIVEEPKKTSKIEAK